MSHVLHGSLEGHIKVLIRQIDELEKEVQNQAKEIKVLKENDEKIRKILITKVKGLNFGDKLSIAEGVKFDNYK